MSVLEGKADLIRRSTATAEARCLRRAALPRSRLAVPSLRRTGRALRASGHPARDTNAQHVYPPFVKIEQVGIEQRTDEVLDHDHQADPRRKGGSAKRLQMEVPHRIEDEATEKAPLDCDVKRLVMRVADDVGPFAALAFGFAAKELQG